MSSALLTPAAFQALFAAHPTPSDWAEHCRRDLLRAYDAPHRAYHNRAHLQHLLEQLHAARSLLRQPETVFAAAWYHDAVYEPLRTDNEDASAALARRHLQAGGLPEAFIRTVVRHIRATRHQAAADNPDTALLLDADLAILGVPETAYRAYAAGVRREYGQVPDAVYRPARRKVLEAFLKKPFLYQTAPFRSALEAPARQNIAGEIRELALS